MTLLSPEQISQFEDEGYLLVPGVLNEAEVAKLRTSITRLFADIFEEDRSERKFLTDVFSRFPELRWVLFHENILAALRGLLGEDFAVIRENAIHFNNFSSGWHRDTHSQEEAGEDFHWNDDYLMVEAALYLQENDDEFGGGLDVYPGTHKEPDVRVSGGRLARKLKEKSKQLFGGEDFVRVQSKPGDLILFHFRVRHRSTPSQHVPPPIDRQKIALFMACSRNNEYVDKYHAYLKSRTEGYEYLDGFSYPPEMLQDAKEADLNLA